MGVRVAHVAAPKLGLNTPAPGPAHLPRRR